MRLAVLAARAAVAALYAFAALAALAAFATAPAVAQGRKRPKAAPAPAPASAKADVDSLNNFKFRNLGPAVAGGRVTAVVGIPGQPNIYYVGAGAGGVWKTTDGGNSWDPVFKDQPTASIGAIALAGALLMTLCGAQALDESKYPDFKGQWNRVGNPNWAPAGAPRPPLTPEYLAVYNANRADMAAGGPGNVPS